MKIQIIKKVKENQSQLLSKGATIIQLQILIKDKKIKNKYEEKIIKGENIRKIKNNKSRDNKNRHSKRSLDTRQENLKIQIKNYKNNSDLNEGNNTEIIKKKNNHFI